MRCWTQGSLYDLAGKCDVDYRTLLKFLGGLPVHHKKRAAIEAGLKAHAPDLLQPEGGANR